MPSIDHYPASAVPWPAAVEWSHRELQRYLAAAADPAVQALPTRCHPWTVRDLTAHLAATFQRFADHLVRARAGDLAAPFAPSQLTSENLRAVRESRGEPRHALDRRARRFLGLVESAEELMGHQHGPIRVGLQVMFGLNELAVHHDDLAHAVGSSYRPDQEVLAVLAEMYDTVFGLPEGQDPWTRLLQATGR
jgi:uncharacterized protein (TIGR03083 family)